MEMAVVFMSKRDVLKGQENILKKHINMYSSRITRKTPTAFIILIDRSGSTEEKMSFGSQVMTKAEAVAMVANMLIREILNRCKRDEGTLDYFEIAAIGYSGDGAHMLLDKDFIKPSVLSHRDVPIRSFSRERVLPDGKTIVTTDPMKYWIEPRCEGSTPMRAALEQALTLAERWCRRPANADSYPPTIFNITDGEASDGDAESLLAVAEQIRALKTNDGNALLININITSDTEAKPVIFPRSLAELPESRYSRMLYEMSSPMPAEYEEMIVRQKGKDVRGPLRGMSYNASIAEMIMMLTVGSRSINKIL